jgi:hypothetical protein
LAKGRWNGCKISIGEGNASRMEYVFTRTTLYGSSSLTLESQADGAPHAVGNGKSEAWLEMGADQPTDISREAKWSDDAQ